MRMWKLKVKRMLVLTLTVALLGGSLDMSGFTVSAEEAVEQTASTGQMQENVSDNVDASVVLVENSVSQTIVPTAELPDNEELFAGYVDKAFYGGVSFFGVSAREQLSTDTSKAFYDALKAEITKVAAGNLESTTFGLDLTALGAKDTYTAAELGVDSILGQDATSGDYFITEEAQNAVDTVFWGQFESNKVLDALLHDCPYELYWFDKSVGISSGYSMSSNGTSLTVKNLSVKFHVAGNYKGADWTKDAPTVNTAITGATGTAVTTANSIVTANAGKTDYEKLVAYKEKLCELVTYNDDAADRGDFSTDNDPWQLIYVFDGNTSTNVVCEGYSKAFQYLCDTSEFTGAECYTVSGTMGGPHMWNIVTMDDGKNYIADVTNSDEGTVGASGGLFLSGGAGAVTTGYTFSTESGDVQYTYDADIMNLWGTGENSILTVASSDYHPSVKSTVTNEAEFMAALADNSVDTITLDGDITISRSLDGKDNAFVIGRDVTITGGTLRLERAGIVLGGAVTFKDTSIYFASAVRNAIIANGNPLTLENVSDGGSAYNIHVFCGGVTDYTGGNASEIPAMGDTAQVTIKGENALGNIYAGSLSDVGDGEADSPNNYSGTATITIENGAGGFGEIYAHGARENRTGGYPNALFADAELYVVSGDVDIELNTPGTVTIYGETGGVSDARVYYTDNGNGYACSPILQDISVLVLNPAENGKMPNLKPAQNSTFSSKGSVVYLQENTRLDLTSMATDLSIDTLLGGGELILGEEQSLTVTTEVDGTTKVAVGGVNATGDASTGTPVDGEIYIVAPSSVVDSFVLIPPLNDAGMTLDRDDAGNWRAVASEEPIIVESVSMSDITVSGDNTGAKIPVDVSYRSTGLLDFLTFVPVAISVNGEAATMTEDESYGYNYTWGSALEFYFGEGDGAVVEALIVGDYGFQTGKVPIGTYTFTFTIPAEHMASGEAYSFTATMTVGGEYEAQVKLADGTVNYYESFETAWTEANKAADTTLTLLQDVQLDAVAAENGLFATKNITVDLNQHTLDLGEGYIYIHSDIGEIAVIIQNGTITSKSEMDVINNCGVLTLEGVDLSNTTGYYGVSGGKNSSLQIIGGSIRGGFFGVSTDGEVILSGSPKITGDTFADFGLWDGTKIILGEALAAGTTYSMWPETGTVYKNLISVADGVTLQEEWFSIDDDRYSMVIDRENNTASVLKAFREEKVSVELVSSSEEYTGSMMIPEISQVVWNDDDSNSLIENTDYTVSYFYEGEPVSEPVNAGTYTIVLTGMGDYVGTVETEYVIRQAAISSVELYVYEPEAGTEPQTMINTDVVYTGTISWTEWDADGLAQTEWDYTTESFGFNSVYEVTVVLTADGNYCFASNAEYPDGYNVTYGEADGLATMTLTRRYPVTRKEQLNGIIPHETIILQDYYTSKEEIVPLLPPKVTAITETDARIELDIEWLTSGEYNATPGEENVFDWVIKDSELLNRYDNIAIVNSGNAMVINAAGIPVEIDGIDTEITYDGNTFDITNLFTIDSNAGTASYRVVHDESIDAGDGYLEGDMLTITKAGKFTIQLITEAQGNYNAGEATAVLTVKKGAGVANVAAEDWIYDEEINITVNSTTNQNGSTITYTGVNNAGESYNSAICPVDAGEYTVTAVYAATDLYEEVSASDTFTIEKATPQLGAVSAANTLYESTQISEVRLVAEYMSVFGSLALVDVTALTVGTKEYNYKLTPNDSCNYKEVIGVVTLTVLENALEYIEVMQNPDKYEYSHGEEFDATGMIVYAWYSDGTYKVITESVSYSKELAAGQTEVVLSYQGKTCTIWVSVNKKQIIVDDNLYWKNVDSNYDGAEKTVTLEGTLPEGVIVTVSNNKATDVGDYLAIAEYSLAEGYSPDIYEIVVAPHLEQFSWCILPKRLSGSNTTYVLGESLTYNGREQTQEVLSLECDGLKVTFEVKDNEATEAGEYLLTVDGAGNFDGYIEIPWRIAKKDIAGAKIVLDTQDGVLTYNGAPQTAQVSDVTVDGLVLQAADYEVSGNRAMDVGEHVLTVTGFGNFTGTATATWRIAPRDIADAQIVLGDALTYDGSEQSQDVSGVTVDGIILQSSDYEISDNKATNAGTYTLTITGKGNYSGTAKKAFSVDKATAPVIAAVEKYYVFKAGTAGETVSIDLAALLPAQAKATGYTLAANDAAYVLDEAVDANGKLTYKVAATGNVGDSTTLTVTVTTDNYEDITLKVNIALTDKFVVAEQAGAAVAIVGTNTLNYGQQLKELILNTEAAVFVVDGTDTKVAGTLTWVTPNEVMSIGTTTAQWIFTPQDTDRYTTLTGNLVIVVEKTTPEVAVPTADGITYHPENTLADVVLNGSDGSATVAGSKVTVEGSWSWKNASDVPTVNNNGYVAVFTPTDTMNYATVEKTVSVQVEKAIPYIETVPSATAVTYGDTLAEATLSGGKVVVGEGSSIEVAGSFAWKDATIEPTVADSDKTAYTVVFTPMDENYEEVTTTITVIVNKAENVENMPKTAMTVAYGCGKVSDVTLPTGWVWQETDKALVLKVGEAVTAVAIYEGADKDNYENLTVTISVTRAAQIVEEEDDDDDETHSHYYVPGVKTEPTCTTVGTQNFKCDCGDSYVWETAALGHTYISRVTKQPGIGVEGIMTFICSRCGDSYNKPIAKLVDAGSNTSGNSGDSQTGNGQTGNNKEDAAGNVAQTVPVGEPFVKGNDDKKDAPVKNGWDNIRQETVTAKDGDTVRVDMNGGVVVPGKVLDTIRGKDVTLVLDMGNGLAWSVNGKSITANKVSDIDFDVTVSTENKPLNRIPVEVINNVSGENYVMELSLAYEGEFGFVAVLSVNVESQNAGKYANLFYYNEEQSSMEFICADQIAEDGMAELIFTHASEYAIVIDEASLEGTDTTVNVNTEVNANASNDTNTSDDVKDADNAADATGGIPTWVIILIAVIVLVGIGIYIVVAKKRKQDEA